MALPKVPKLLDVRGLDPALKPLADRTWEWVSGAQDLLRALRQGVLDGTIGGGGAASTATTAGTADVAKALKDTSGSVDVSASPAPSAGQVLTATDPTHATWQTPASAPVSSVFGRTGAVTAQTGDYTAAQVTGAVPDTRQIIAGSGLSGGGTLAADRTLTLDADASGKQIELPWHVTNTFTMRDGQGSVVPRKLQIDAGAKVTFAAGARAHVHGHLGTARPRWIPDTPSASPHFQNDHFDDGSSSWNGKWKTFDPGAVLTNSVDATRRMGKLTMTGNASTHAAGKFQPVLYTEFAAYTRMFGSCNILASGGLTYGLAVFADIINSPSTAAFYWVKTSKVSNGATSIICHGAPWTNYTTPGVAGTTCNYDMDWFRLRLSGTTVSADVSRDGISWNQIHTVALSFTPQHVGPAMFVQDSGITANVYVDFFEIQYGSGNSGIDATQIGQYV